MLAEPKTKDCIYYKVAEDFPEEGVRFIDLTPSIVSPNHRTKILSKMVNYIENELEDDIDAIISPDARGFIWGMGVASLMNCSLVPVRKHGKLPKSCIIDSIDYKTEYSTTSLDLPAVNVFNKKLVFVDDVFATGGTYEACKRMVEAQGGEIVKAVVIYDVGITDEYKDEVWSISRGDL